MEGCGLRELELAEAVWLVEAVVDAINNQQPIADISRMFNRDFWIYDKSGYTGAISREAIAETLYERLFKKIYEDDEKIVVKLKWRCLL